MTRRIIIAALLLAGCVARAGTDDEWDTAIGQTEQVTSGLVAYWAMRNDGTTVFDEYGSYNGGASNGVAFAYEHGAVGHGASFTRASSHYITVPDAAAFRSATTISFFAWLYPTDVTNLPVNDAFSVGGKYDTGGDLREWSLRWNQATGAGALDAGKLSIQFGNPANGTFLGRYLTGQVLTDANVWYFVGFTFAGGTVTVYVNGVAVAGSTQTGSIPATLYQGAAPVTIGRSGGAGYAAGRIDEVRLYNRALSADEIKQLYRMGALPRGIK